MNNNRLSPIDEAKMSYHCTTETTRLKAMIDKLTAENQRLLRENDELKEKIKDYQQMLNLFWPAKERAKAFMEAFEDWLTD